MSDEMTMISPSKMKVLHYKFTIEEVKALYRLFEREWIPRDDEEILQVIRRITNIVNNELATRDSSSTSRT